MYAAGCWYRDGFGTDPDPVQAMRWYLTMLVHDDCDGAPEVLEATSQTSRPRQRQ